MDIIFLGSGAFGIPSLEALAASSHRILHVISQPDRPAGRGKQLTPTPVSAWATARGLPLLRTENANAPDVISQVRESKAEALVVIAFGQKLSQDLLTSAPRGGINLHSSLLPKYRGAAPINWAVINNDAEAGVTVITVTAVMDGGDILARAATPIGRAETAGELHDRLALLGAPLVPRVLDEMASNTTRREKQEPGVATRAPKLSREMAWVDFSQPAEIVSARIRGMSPWPGVQLDLLTGEGDPRARFTVVKCEATTGSGDPGRVNADLTVACGRGGLKLLLVQPIGKKPMPIEAFVNGYGFGPKAQVRPAVIAPSNP